MRHGTKSRPDAGSAPNVDQLNQVRSDPSPSRRKSSRNGPCSCRLEQRIELDLDDGVKMNYPKLQEVLAPIPGLAAKEE